MSFQGPLFVQAGCVDVPRCLCCLSSLWRVVLKRTHGVVRRARSRSLGEHQAWNGEECALIVSRSSCSGGTLSLYDDSPDDALYGFDEQPVDAGDLQAYALGACTPSPTHFGGAGER